MSPFYNAIGIFLGSLVAQLVCRWIDKKDKK